MEFPNGWRRKKKCHQTREYISEHKKNIEWINEQKKIWKTFFPGAILKDSWFSMINKRMVAGGKSFFFFIRQNFQFQRVGNSLEKKVAAWFSAYKKKKKKIKARFEQQQQKQKHRNFFFLISPTIRNNNPYNSNDKLDCYSFFFGFGFGNLPCFKTCTLFSHFSFFFCYMTRILKKNLKMKNFLPERKKKEKKGNEWKRQMFCFFLVFEKKSFCKTINEKL